MEKMGVISKVNGPTDWCAGMVVVYQQLRSDLKRSAKLKKRIKSANG